MRAKEFDLDAEDHYNYKIWDYMGWKSSTLRLKGLKGDIKLKRDNINLCKEYRNSGGKQKARGESIFGSHQTIKPSHIHFTAVMKTKFAIFS